MTRLPKLPGPFALAIAESAGADAASLSDGGHDRVGLGSGVLGRFERFVLEVEGSGRQPFGTYLY